MDQPTIYQIRVQGHLSSLWMAWFDGLKIENRPDGEPVLTGSLADQAALHGVLGRIHDLGPDAYRCEPHRGESEP
jgi:hypothetical protein